MKLIVLSFCLNFSRRPVQVPSKGQAEVDKVSRIESRDVHKCQHLHVNCDSRITFSIASGPYFKFLTSLANARAHPQRERISYPNAIYPVEPFRN